MVLSGFQGVAATRGDESMKRELRLGACLKESVSFLPRAYAGGWGAILLAIAPTAFLLSRPVFDAVNSFQVRAWQVALVLAALTATGLVRDGALYRLAVGDDVAEAKGRGLGPAGLQWRAGESRLLAAALLVSLFLLLIAVAGFVVATFVAAAAGLSEVDWSTVDSMRAYMALGEPWRMWAVLGVIAAATGLLVFLAAKLSLYAAATIGRGRTVSLDALALADGNGLKLLAALVIVHLPLVAALVLTDRLLGGAGLLASGIVLAVAGLLQAPLTVGFLGAAYRALEYVQPQEQRG